MSPSSTAAGDGAWTIGGFKLYVEDRGDNGLDSLYQATQASSPRPTRPRTRRIFSSFTINTPQLDANVTG